MKYRAPFYAVYKALYAALSEIDGITWFQSSVPPADIETYFKNRSEYCYGIIGVSSADAQSNKDTAFWKVTVYLEIYSNYKGSKVVSQKLEAVVNYLCALSNHTLSENLYSEGFGLGSVVCGAMTINDPVFSDAATWVTGGIQLGLNVTQL